MKGRLATALVLLAIGSVHVGDIPDTGVPQSGGTVSGDLSITGGNSKGALTTITTRSETLTFAGDPGNASKTTNGLVLAGDILLAITTRTTTAGTNCTSIDIGDGTDVDLFADNASVSDSQTTDSSDATAEWPPLQRATGEVTVTGVGGPCFGLVIDVTAHVLTVTAETSDT